MPPDTTTSRCYLIDGPIYFFRSWFALPQNVFHPNGEVISGTLGFTRFIIEFLGKHQPPYCCCAFDESLHQGERNNWLPAYKASRAAPDSNIVFQFQLCKQLVELLGVCMQLSQAYEADDLLAAAANTARTAGLPVTVLSYDKDLIQLINTATDAWWAYPKQPPRQREALLSVWGVEPEQIADLLALTGDNSDDIPGVPGIGKQTAAKLLTQFKTLAGIYSHLDQLGEAGIRGAARIRTNLQQHREQALLAQRLTRLYPEAVGAISLENLQWQGPQPGLEEFMAANGMNRYLSWAQRLRQVYRG